ncbi:MAG: tRNA uridine-5-carboxymethylaminomethyl(34) synthesis GTPase MnmE [Microscillaceae bacterium]|nr:tRNA uridine-5-carboxymethylaminomethyl(34) synthesis GTPase MnmE [Microscillaceae bacterium]MDW8460697.1 tRNA uridine-5-carboxymethylaminomethyl(34) synthesis GTPase MnmE [Cytophagales bacterium]
MQTLRTLSQKDDTIVALATPNGKSAIAVIRISGKDAIQICQSIFSKKNLTEQPSHTCHFGTIRNEKNEVIDEVIVTIFKEPTSFTKENLVEISCHGSNYIISQIIQLLLAKGCRYALAGEFTQRAYLNGQFDLAQAEAIADLIQADSEVAHRLAIQQMRGGYSQKIKALRERLIHFAALMELELDFSEEDVEFANRQELKQQLTDIEQFVKNLLQSYRLGNVLKNGVPVAIIGKPNAGKSTLLNALLQEEKAIVSEIEGTTRDAIEDERIIQGICFRFIDTAGLRTTTDVIERIGIERTQQKIRQAAILLYIFDIQKVSPEELAQLLPEIQSYQVPYLLVANKIDTVEPGHLQQYQRFENVIFISAQAQINLEQLEQRLLQIVQADKLSPDQIVVTNLRHYESLQKTLIALQQVAQGMQVGLSTEMLAADMREAIFHLGTIIGEVSHEDLLDFIFSKFCIGK